MKLLVTLSRPGRSTCDGRGPDSGRVCTNSKGSFDWEIKESFCIEIKHFLIYLKGTLKEPIIHTHTHTTVPLFQIENISIYVADICYVSQRPRILKE